MECCTTRRTCRKSPPSTMTFPPIGWSLLIKSCKKRSMAYRALLESFLLFLICRDKDSQRMYRTGTSNWNRLWRVLATSRKQLCCNASPISFSHTPITSFKDVVREGKVPPLKWPEVAKTLISRSACSFFPCKSCNSWKMGSLINSIQSLYKISQRDEIMPIYR